MSARVFLSYRTADGVDKAVALARDLGARFGDERVFLDKDDLSAGGSWRAEIAREVAQRPIVLALVTPLYLGALDAGGARRIASPDDPVRAEWQAAMDAGAHVVPLLADGVDALPPAAELPETFRSLHERTWRRLRAYDWRHDVERLTQDLVALGVEPLAPSDAGSTAGSKPAEDRRRAVKSVALAAAVLLVVLALQLTVFRRDDSRERAAGPHTEASQPVSAPASAVAAAPARLDLAGRWRTELSASQPPIPGDAPLAFVATWSHEGDRVRFLSDPVDITDDPRWTNHRDHWKQKTGTTLTHVVWRGVGTVVTAGTEPGFAPSPDAPQRIAIELTVHAERARPEDDWLQKGGLFAPVERGARRLEGRVWLSSERGERRAAVWRVP
jgi:hypothetical protein